MRFTIFGSSGFIGGRLAQHLRAAGHEVLAPQRGEDLAQAPRGGFGHAIWCIGLTAGFRQRPFDTVEAHVGALAPVLRAAAHHSFLYLSSTRVYQRSASAEETAATTAHASDPSDLYNLSKLMGESLCLTAGGPQARVARLSNIVGPGEAARDTFLGALCREARQGHIVLQTAPTSAKDYLWIEDAVGLLARIAAAGCSPIYNVARGVNIGNDAWAAAIAREAGATVAVAESAPAIVFPPIAIDRARAEFAFDPIDPLPRAAQIYRPPAAATA